MKERSLISAVLSLRYLPNGKVVFSYQIMWLGADFFDDSVFLLQIIRMLLFGSLCEIKQRRNQICFQE